MTSLATAKRPASSDLLRHVRAYSEKLSAALDDKVLTAVVPLAEALREAWRTGKTVYLCGNGGSAANAIHLAGDYLHGAGVTNGIGMRTESLSANPSVMSSLANDVGYDQVFAEQLRVKANAGDLLIALSGSGNSPNVVCALEMANSLGMKTFAILGYSGGRCKAIAQHPIHVEIDDMQIAEDCQMAIGHMCMQWLMANPLREKP
jgi:D-sedoheptulose 7-phosphate isomerase